MIYHLTETSRWQQSIAAGEHTESTRGLELSEVGFIHCSTEAQWPVVRDRFYVDVIDLLLLHIDQTRLTVPVRFEQIDDAPEAFPHVYGPIPLDAIVEVEELSPPYR